MAGLGRPLTAAEIESYDVLPSDLARRVRVVGIPAIPGGYAGITFGRYVFLVPEVADDGTSTLMAHELIHVRQWSELGIVGFSLRYSVSFVRNLVRLKRWKAAYNRIDAEVEAQRLTTDWLRRRTRPDTGSNA